jgi:uncharacterized BrkB/YihY/UPF0761 family membrane protein
MNYYLSQKQNNRKPKKSFFRKLNIDLILVIPMLIMFTLILILLLVGN